MLRPYERHEEFQGFKFFQSLACSCRQRRTSTSKSFCVGFGIPASNWLIIARTNDSNSSKGLNWLHPNVKPSARDPLLIEDHLEPLGYKSLLGFFDLKQS